MKIKITVNSELSAGVDVNIMRAVNEKFSGKIVEFPTLPRIGEWIDLLEIAHLYNLSSEELEWLKKHEHKYQIENVNKCDGFIEVELDLDKIWPEEA